MAGTADKSISQLSDLALRLSVQPGVADVLLKLREGKDATIDGAWGSSTSLVTAALGQQAPSSVVVVLPHEKDVDGYMADTAAFGIEPQVFPSWAALPQELSIIDPVLANRLRILRSFESVAPPRIVVTTIQALLQSVPTPEARAVASRTIKVGGELDLDDLTAWLIGRGFERVTALELPGEFCIHGGIVDVFSPDTSHPVRIELFGDEIESIRLFDVESQRKIKDLDEIAITIVTPTIVEITEEAKPAKSSKKNESVESATTALTSSAVDSFPASAWVVFVDLAEIVNEGKRYLDRLADPRGLFSVDSTLKRCTGRPFVSIAPILADSNTPTCHLQVESIERFSGPKGEALQELARMVQQDETVLIACHNEAARMRLSELMNEVFLGPRDDENSSGAKAAESSKPVTPFGQNRILPTANDAASTIPQKKEKKAAALPPMDPAVQRPVMDAGAGGGLKRFLRGPAKDDSAKASPAKLPDGEKKSSVSEHWSESSAATPDEVELASRSAAHPLLSRVRLCVGHVSHGFRLRTEKILVLSDNELFGRTEVQRTTRRSKIESRAIDSFLDLNSGDLVVHLSHGIARFRGMEVQQKGDHTEDHLALEFGGDVKMYVPVSLIHLVQKYIGGAKSSPELSKLGGSAWANKKKRVTEAVCDMASDMIKLQADRDMKPGLQCPPDSHWVEEFDAAFPYTETDDQLRAITDLKQDMERPRPMDRLICGDVGYGKTEVAMRAAFKAVDAGRQVAILVPTTVLCEQHFRTLSERMAEFPVNISSLSRFKSAKEVRETLQGLAQGTVDICIGTHRLVSKDVKFKDLGLLVIDEEQRFGVESQGVY